MAANGKPLASNDGEFWIFGYGIPGWVTGYVRRFWQASEDHRGTPENPGRVVTLLERSFWETLTDHHEEAPDRVWGVAYRIKADKIEEVKEYLDIREINGYTIHYAPFQPADGSAPVRTLVYIGTPDNPQFVGSQDPQALAEHIHRSEGPSGLNRDYLLSLDDALTQLGPESGDEHIADLSRRVRAMQADRLLNRQSQQPTGQGDATSRHPDFHKVRSTEEQEEMEKSS